MSSIALVGLVQLDLPSDTVRLADGGVIKWSSDLFPSSDDKFGTIAAVKADGEGVGDEVPALTLDLIPADTSTLSDLSAPGFQRSRARFWITEFDPATGLVVGTPDLMFDGQVDQSTLVFENRNVEVSLAIVSTAERLFELNIGNALSPSHHKSLFPGETGLDNMTGLVIPVAWGVRDGTVSSAGRGGSGRGAGSGDGRGGGRNGLQEY